MFAAQSSRVLITIFDQQITVLDLGVVLVSWVIAFSLYHVIARYLLPALFNKEEVPEGRQRIIRRWFIWLLILTLIVFALRSLHLDQLLFQDNEFTIRLSSIFLGLSVLLIARFLDWYIAKVLLHRYYLRRNDLNPLRPVDRVGDTESKASRIVQYILYVIVGIVLLRGFDLNYSLFIINSENGSYNFRLTSILSVLLILLLARLIAWIFTQLVLYSYYQRRNIDPGRRYAVNQLITYFIYVIGVFLAIDNLGIEMTVLWGGIAALLVGIGLGLQEIFKDLISGIILLFERTVEVGDVIELSEGLGVIKKIGLRTSLMHTPRDTIAIVPNSKLISSNVVNWTHSQKQARFSVKVGVSYDSDPKVVERILVKSAGSHPLILRHPNPFVRFTDFGDSALIFELFFWSDAIMNVDDVKSDLRFEISGAFQNAQISVPFPQMDVWVKQPKDPS
ncbi:MAG: mechanosensitive ion channel [Saprospiraceae bacterium]|nr:mechanosensitive ion channel [Saprospiraceae bacterium]